MFLESLTTVEFISPHAIMNSPLENAFVPMVSLPALGFLPSVFSFTSFIIRVIFHCETIDAVQDSNNLFSILTRIIRASIPSPNYKPTLINNVVPGQKRPITSIVLLNV
ncbi:hypothetical protein BDC45DRAFT_601084 [Circinella umbellata]|nr:hypothetical protein BDC45DRAFT_601084 [Circinella umbellata]